LIVIDLIVTSKTLQKYFGTLAIILGYFPLENGSLHPLSVYYTNSKLFEDLVKEVRILLPPTYSMLYPP